MEIPPLIYRKEKIMKNVNRWFYAVIGVAILFFAGVVYAWSVMSGPIALEYSEAAGKTGSEVWNAANLSLAFTMVMIFFCIGALVGGFLAKKVLTRYYIWCSAVLFLAGFILASKATSLSALYISYGVICGFASGISYSAVMGTVGKWFPDKQGTISGILLMGFGISAFVIGKVYQAFTPSDVAMIGNWRASFVLLGIISAAVLAICGLFIKKPGDDFIPPEPGTKKKTFVNPVSQESAPSVMLKRPAFWLYYIWSVLLSAGGLALVSQARGIAHEVGASISPSTIATVVGLISVFNGIGRVILGGLFDKIGRSKLMQIVNAIFIITGLILVFALTSKNFTVLTLGFIVGGLAYGGVTPTNSAFVSSYYGMQNYPMNFSIINTVLIFASFGSTIAGSLYDMSNSYFSTCMMIGGLAVCGIFVCLGINVCDAGMLKKMNKKS